MGDLLKCCKCNAIEESTSLFWSDGDIDTDTQYRVSEFMTSNGLEHICDYCYDDVKEEMLTAKEKRDMKSEVVR